MQKILSEYPRPQLVRDSYKSLNGFWDYKITKNPEIPADFDGKILVPFSPETKLSGVNHILQPDEFLYYRLKFSLDDFEIKDKVILHFLAVDQIAEVYLNGKFLGKHIGGFLPFSFEIQDVIQKENELIVKVQDLTDTSYYSRGKQKLEHGGIWYTPQSGIYFPVFIESVSNDYIEDLRVTPDIDNEEVILNIKSSAPKAKITLEDGIQEVETNKDVHIKINNMHLWSPEDPYLYNFKISTNGDEVSSYFAMRKFSLINDENGIPRLSLNNKPYFMKGVLDQGYYSDSLLTPPTYDAYIKDIELVKSLGFNMIRKHIKIEIPRWYYECDKRGMIVWQDFVNGGEKYKLSTIVFPLIFGKHHNDHNYKKFSRLNEDGRKEAIQEFKDTINYLYNVPSIGLWTIFNEGWGQFDSKEIYEELLKLDNTRPYDHASGWHDQGVSEVKSYHVYFKPFKLKNPKIPGKRAIILSEFGGFVLPIEGHMIKGNHVYKSFDTKDGWLEKYRATIERDVIQNIPKGLSAIVYTQLSDVEEELNGFVTFDREVVKVKPDIIKKINSKITL
ncbi:MAG: glycoside hydrolase family 2, partial [Bacilli bacterium]|nr:glycoside hydrolase family 2 [Bacilli bacterium]